MRFSQNKQTSGKALLKWPPTRKGLCLILSNSPVFIYSVYYENYRESKLKVFLRFITFLKLSCDKTMYLCNVFEARNLLPPSLLLVLQIYFR